MQSLGALASFNQDPDMIVQAIAMDPLTCTRCTLPEIREMTAAMLNAQREWLPQFEGKDLTPVPVINTPQDTAHAEVPLDPALAIANRFGTLAEQATS